MSTKKTLYSRSAITECMEKMLNTGIEVQNQCHVHVNMLLVQATAHSVYEDLSESDDNAQPFSASTGCFSRFTKRYNFYNIKMIGKAASADVVAVTHCVG